MRITTNSRVIMTKQLLQINIRKIMILIGMSGEGADTTINVGIKVPPRADPNARLDTAMQEAAVKKGIVNSYIRIYASTIANIMNVNGEMDAYLLSLCQ